MSADLKDGDASVQCHHCGTSNHITIDTIRYSGEFDCVECNKCTVISDGQKIEVLLHFMGELIELLQSKDIIA